MTDPQRDGESLARRAPYGSPGGSFWTLAGRGRLMFPAVQRAGVNRPDRAVGTDAGFYAATFNSLPASLAVIDLAGVIVAVNAAWTAFSEDNGGAAGSGVGANYLDACAGVLNEDEGSTAREAAAGLRAILTGTRDELVLTYDCHSPRERRLVRHDRGARGLRRSR